MDTDPPASDEHLLSGRYSLGPVLGRGAMADVHRAHDTLLDRDVAIKVFRRIDLAAAELRRAGEVQLLAGLSHPGLVTIYDAGRSDDGDFGYLVLELVDGPSLRQRLDAGPLDNARTARLGSEVAAALAYVHSRGIVHRDVKPANILIAPDGSARLTDFGVARLLDAAQLTVEGATLGTANYLSPEQASGGGLSGASDVYALGLVLLECLTGALAFPGGGVAAAGARLHRDPDVPDALGGDWVALLTAMTSRDPAARPPAGTVAERLAAVPSSIGPVRWVEPTEILAAPVARSRRRPGVLGAAIGATIAAIVALAVILAISAGSDGTAGSPVSTSPSSSPSSSPTPTHPPTSSSRPSPTTSAPSSSTPAPTTSATTPTATTPTKKPGPPKKPKPPKKHKPHKPHEPHKPPKPHKLWSGVGQ